MSDAKVYKCDVCGREHLITTNHDGGCWSYCGYCSWRSGFDSQRSYYRADIGKLRPQVFVRRADDVDIQILRWAENGESI